MDPVQIASALEVAGPAVAYLTGLIILYRQGINDRKAAADLEKERHKELLAVIDRYHESNEELVKTLSIIAERLDEDDRTQ